jgi:YesN/AraC family two-component response regulator
MVCPRCVKVVREELNRFGFKPVSVELGEAVLDGLLTDSDLDSIRKILEENGFELIDDKKKQIIDKIKTVIIELVHFQSESDKRVNLSEYLPGKLGYDYSWLSHLFSSMEGITIEKFLIHHKVEKVKELLIYDELSLDEIAWRLGYSSVQHLSGQFKKITGLSPSYYKKYRSEKRKSLDEI